MENEADKLYSRMVDDMTVVINRWVSQGIQPAQVFGYLMKMVCDSHSAADIEYALPRALLDAAYGMNNMVRPTVKA